MTIEVDHTVSEIDSDVTITDVETFTSATDLDRFIVDVYLEDSDGHTINLELASGAAYELWVALGRSQLVADEADEKAPVTVESEPEG